MQAPVCMCVCLRDASFSNYIYLFHTDIDPVANFKPLIKAFITEANSCHVHIFFILLPVSLDDLLLYYFNITKSIFFW